MDSNITNWECILYREEYMVLMCMIYIERLDGIRDNTLNFSGCTSLNANHIRILSAKLQKSLNIGAVSCSIC